MKVSDALQHFGTPVELSRAAGVTRQAVTKWRRTGFVPFHSATILHHASRGAVPLHPEHYGPGGRIVAGRAA